jgi:hypothetical protein
VTWALGKTSPKKRIHRPECRYALLEYTWAGDLSEVELFDALVESGAARWHNAGQCCSADLDWALYYATQPRGSGLMARHRARLDGAQEASA